MYKLYWAPDTGALAPQILLEEVGAEYEVLEHLLSTGVACWFRDGVSLEWHETAERDRANERQRIMRRLRACGIGVRTEEGVSRYVS